MDNPPETAKKAVFSRCSEGTDETVRRGKAKKHSTREDQNRLGEDWKRLATREARVLTDELIGYGVDTLVATGSGEFRGEEFNVTSAEGALRVIFGAYVELLLCTDGMEWRKPFLAAARRRFEFELSDESIALEAVCAEWFVRCHRMVDHHDAKLATDDADDYRVAHEKYASFMRCTPSDSFSTPSDSAERGAPSTATD